MNRPDTAQAHAQLRRLLDQQRELARLRRLETDGLLTVLVVETDPTGEDL